MAQVEAKAISYQRSFADHAYQQIGYYGRAIASVVLPVVKRHMRSPIADLGCGDGSLIHAARRFAGPPLFGMDIARGQGADILGSIAATPFATKSLRTVFVTEVLEHLEDAQLAAALAECARILVPQGALIVTVPFEEDLDRNSHACPKCGHKFHHVGHRQSFGQKRLHELLRGSGFTPLLSRVYCIGAMTKLPLGRWFNWLFRRLRYESIAKTLLIVARRT